LFLTCSRHDPDLAASTLHDPVMPELRIPAHTLVLREHLSSRGPERTGNWWALIDEQGCYTEAHNSWMWVTDPALQASEAWTLHWNGSPSPDPWFCLRPPQLARLKAAAGRVETPGDAPCPAGPLDRWTVVVDGAVSTTVIALGEGAGGFEPLVHAVQQIAMEGVWGQSPERGHDTGFPSTAFMP
jgi:hypothetical protein